MAELHISIIFITVVVFGVLSITTIPVEATEWTCDSENDNEENGICWKLQDEKSRPSVKPGDPCEITRLDEYDEVHNSQIIIDPCMDEENRNFMECVLEYDPSISENDTRYNKGKCECYKLWNTRTLQHPLYNHSINLSGHDWFEFSEEKNECVVKLRQKCGTTDPISLPYRCAPVKDDTGHVITEARCYEMAEDPRYKMCTAVSGAVTEAIVGLRSETYMLGYIMAVIAIFIYLCSMSEKNII